MKFKVAQEMFEKLPTYKVGVLVIQGLNNTKPEASTVDMSYALMANTSVKLRRAFQLNQENRFANSRSDAMLKFGIDTAQVNPSHIALWNRICLDEKVIPNINPLINVLNAQSLLCETPLGAHDIDKTEGDIAVGQNSTGLSFTEMNTGKKTPVDAKEVVYADNADVLTRNWIWRQSDKDKITEATKNVLVPIDTLNMSDTDVTALADKILASVKKFVPYVNASFAIVSKENQEVEIEKMATIEPKSQVADFVEPGVVLDRKTIDQILSKAVENILPSKERLEELLISGIRTKLYQGFDPTGDTLHIGHAVMMRKLEDFRRLGHKVLMLIGDFTGRIGDPTDKGTARKQLTAEQVQENLKLYTQQASAILDITNKENPVEVVFNNDWLGKLNFADIIEIASHFTVQQMIKREMFQKRLEEDKPIFLHEFFYPLMQGYDSVVLNVDIEVGGNDQLFNMLAGRDLVMAYNHKEKFVVAGKLLTTADGNKMGKSEGNMIKLSDSAVNIYGKVMAFPDEQIVPGFELLTSASLDELTQYKKQLDEGTNPIELKKMLAFRLTKELKGEQEATAAQKYFEEVFQNKSYSEVEIPEIQVNEDELPILKMLTEITHFAASNGEAKRLIEQGSVKVNDVKTTSAQDVVKVNEPVIIKVGKKIARLKSS